MPGNQPQQPANGEPPTGTDQAAGEPGWPDELAELAGLVLVPGSEPVPAARVLMPEPAGGPGDGAGGGLCWSFDVDLDSILAAAAKGMPGAGAAGMLPGLAGGQSPDHAGAGPGGGSLADGGVASPDVVAEYLPGSSALAAWLDQRDPAETSDYDLPAVAAGWRRVAAFAQAREFAAIAQIAARSAARDEKAGLEKDGRPTAVTPDAAAQVALALALSPGTAQWWTGQAVTLTWRLPGTGAALAAGQIDAYRARLITEATDILDEDTARKVENDVLPGAGELTYAQLRSRLRRAVIIADPDGAEDRRKAAERRARVSLYPDDDGTATLTGTSLPAPHAAAAMARITALARAMKASGADGGTDYLRAYIYLGLLLGTLPPVPPPAEGQPPDPSPDDDPPPPDDPHGDDDQPPPDDGEQPGSPPPGSSRPADLPGDSSGTRPPKPGPPASRPPGPLPPRPAPAEPPPPKPRPSEPQPPEPPPPELQPPPGPSHHRARSRPVPSQRVQSQRVQSRPRPRRQAPARRPPPHPATPCPAPPLPRSPPGAATWITPSRSITSAQEASDQATALSPGQRADPCPPACAPFPGSRQDHPLRVTTGCTWPGRKTLIRNFREGAMANRMRTHMPRPVRLNTAPLVFGAELIAAGSVLLMAGFAVGGMTMMSTTRRWISDQNMPPGEIVRHHWRKTVAATTAGATAWQDHTPAR